MMLSGFIQSLLTDGHMTVGDDIPAVFEPEDTAAAVTLLEAYYAEDILEMPYTAPAFHREAAVWAAGYLFKAVQLTVLRHIPAEEIETVLMDFPDAKTIEVLYSADLMLRYLPDLFALAKGLAPADVLVTRLRRTAQDWPFSSTGIALEEVVPDDRALLENRCLRQAYADRIIARADRERLKLPHIRALVQETLGTYTKELLPVMETLI